MSKPTLRKNETYMVNVRVTFYIDRETALQLALIWRDEDENEKNKRFPGKTEFYKKLRRHMEDYGYYGQCLSDRVREIFEYCYDFDEEAVEREKEAFLEADEYLESIGWKATEKNCPLT